MLNPDLLKKYLANQLSPDEWQTFRQALQRANPSDLPEDLLEQLWQDSATASSLPPDASARLSAEFRQRIATASQPEPRRIAPLWYRAAAVVSLLLTGAALWVWLGQRSFTEHTTGYGEIRTVTLPDNSVVTLNAHSSLRYAEPWDTLQPREVWLDGEAFFSVVHTASDQRFRVHLTNDFRVEVLGTEFNVRDRRDEAQVVLKSGKVRLAIAQADRPRDITMQPGELVEFSEADRVLTQKRVDPEPYAAWRHHRMVFDEMPLREVAEALEDHYGVTVTIPDADLAQTHLTGAFPTRNLDMILIALPTIIDMDVVRDEDRIILRNKQTTASETN